MTIIELNARKAEIVRAILNDIETEEALDALSDLLRKLHVSRQPPCQYTVEELNDRAEQAIRDYEAGKGIPHEEIKRKTVI